MSSESDWRKFAPPSTDLESIAQRCEQNTGWKPMVLYVAVASSLLVHGDSSRDGSKRSLDRLENNVA
jgi:hypothetical protein